jgi:PhzF family phenazine biosynthesis protein
VHVDVFSATPFGGNSLAVFSDGRGLSGDQMLRVTKELRHFESIFLIPSDDPDTVGARVFDLLEELPFAGHPLLGAAAVLHRAAGPSQAKRWTMRLSAASVEVKTRSTPDGYFALMTQGEPGFLGVVADRPAWAAAFGLGLDDLDPLLPVEAVTTGLSYVIVPVRPGALERARVMRDIAGLANQSGAQFAVLLDNDGLEIRHWSNDGLLEDVATGSAAGTIGAYRRRHQQVSLGTSFVLRQGRFAGRPSTLHVHCQAADDAGVSVLVGGDIAIVGHGAIDVLP